jgi:hypothetical protein
VLTVIFAVPVATVLFEFVAIAVIVVPPWPTPVATPPAFTVATCVSLEYHATWVVAFTVPPKDVVPMAKNCIAWFGVATACDPGIIESETSDVLVTVPPVAVTVTVALELTLPVNPGMVAVTVVDPAETPVQSPLEFTITTEGELDAQVTVSVTSCEVAGWPLL